ncbi:MAG TPA: hypothetical protein VFN00_12205, partial [Arthrobacter sp.]|nr:hypothetical protein [Arthrobacter sp.]
APAEQGNSAWAHENAAAHRAAGQANAEQHRDEHAATPAAPAYGSGPAQEAEHAPAATAAAAGHAHGKSGK